MWETNDVHEFKEGKRLVLINLCCMAHKYQSRFLQMLRTATNNGVGLVKFIKTWNHYAQEITEHVFYEIKPLEPQTKYRQREE